MERKDYLLRYFELLGQVIARLMGLKRKGQYDEALEEIENSFSGLFKFNLADIDAVETDKLVYELSTKKKLNNDQLRVIAELSYERAEIYALKEEEKSALLNYRRSLVLFEFIDDSEKVFSIDQNEKMKKIRNIIG